MDVAQQSPESHLARFRLQSFRPGQRDVVSAVLEGHDCLCIMPTGGGKSLCYQLPAVARHGLTLVVSPLIALMKDQVDALSALAIAATYINSSLLPAEAFDRMNQMAAGRYDLVYIAPERLRSSVFLEKLRETHVQLLAVDEAHCISEWGHDFRPDYARLGRLRERLGRPQTIALTATATPEVRRDIVAQLQLHDPQVFITGFSRPNLSFEAEPVHSDAERDERLNQFLRETPGAGIIYSATRKGCDELLLQLKAATQRRVAIYHAGLEPDDRRRVQEDFMTGNTPIIIATNAFGMGIDKPDLRFVVHYNIPGTLEAYYQEAGRAGRDGLPSRCLLLYAPRDRRIQEFFIDSAYPEPEVVEQVYDFLRKIDDDPIELTLDEIRERLNLPIRSEGVSACEKLLEKCKALERLDARQNMAAVRLDSDLPTLVDLLPKDAKIQRRVLQALERRVGGERYERVYFQPRQIAQTAEIDMPALQRALKELSKLEAFDFVPPFRGRAVHMLERKKPFAQLGIDFAEQQRRKEGEYAKLDRMIRYALARGCRQIEILDYFGDPSRQPCTTCDNCRQNPASRQRRATDKTSPASKRLPPSSDELQDPHLLNAVRIALSGVARTKGRFGKQMIARMLVGSRAKEIEKFRLNQLSTFGLLEPLRETEAAQLIEALLSARLLQQVEERPHRPLVHLTPRGEEIMKGLAVLDSPLGIGPALLTRLRELKIPTNPPRQAESPRTPQRLSDSFEQANAALASAEDEADESHFTPPAEPGIGARSAHYWTLRVLEAGFTADECQQIRAIDRPTLLAHLLTCADEGCAIDLKRVFTVEKQQLLARWKSNGAPGRPVTASDPLPAGITPLEAELYRRLAA